MSNPDTLKIIPPKELWLLYVGGEPPWLTSVDDAPYGETFLWARTKAEAIAAAKHQLESYGVNCVPFKVETK